MADKSELNYAKIVSIRDNIFQILWEDSKGQWGNIYLTQRINGSFELDSETMPLDFCKKAINLAIEDAFNDIKET